MKTQKNPDVLVFSQNPIPNVDRLNIGYDTSASLYLHKLLPMDIICTHPGLTVWLFFVSVLLFDIHSFCSFVLILS